VPTYFEIAYQNYLCLVPESSGDLPPSPPAEQATTREDQAGKSSSDLCNLVLGP
jgi:hypothetical protein